MCNEKNKSDVWRHILCELDIGTFLKGEKNNLVVMATGRRGDSKAFKLKRCTVTFNARDKVQTQAGVVKQDLSRGDCSSDGRHVAGREGTRLWGRLVFGAGFVQDGDLCHCAAFSEQRTPAFAVAQVPLSLPLPKPLLQFCLHLNTHVLYNKRNILSERTRLQTSCHLLIILLNFWTHESI